MPNGVKSGLTVTLTKHDRRSMIGILQLPSQKSIGSFMLSSLLHLFKGSMENAKPRRNYIRRKRCLTDCAKIIAGTLRYIYQTKNQKITEEKLFSMATSHAKQIEAACWVPHIKMTDEDYQQLTQIKTAELCSTLLGRSIPHFERSLASTPIQQAVAPKSSMFTPIAPDMKSSIPSVPQPPDTSAMKEQLPFEIYPENYETGYSRAYFVDE